MDREKLEQSRQWVRGEVETCVRSWQKHGLIPLHGGVYTCLDGKGKFTTFFDDSFRCRG